LRRCQAAGTGPGTEPFVAAGGRAGHSRPAGTATEAVRWAERISLARPRSTGPETATGRSSGPSTAYDERGEEVLSCRTVAELYERLDRRGLPIPEFDEV